MGNPINLRFRWPVEPTPGPVTLRFGDPDTAPDEVIGTLDAALLPPEPLLTISVAASLLLDLPDADGVSAHMPSLARAPRATGALAVQQQHADHARIAGEIPHTGADPLGVGIATRQQHADRLGRRARLPHQHGLRRHGGITSQHAESIRTRRPLTEHYQHGLPISNSAHFAHAEAIRIRRRLEPGHQHGLQTATGASIGHHAGLRVGLRLWVGHQQMIPLPVGWWQAVYPWPPPPIPQLPGRLRFCRLADGTTRLVFGCPPIIVPPEPPAGIVIPVLEYYVVINQFNLLRADDGRALECEAFQLSLDADSYTWGWSATIRASQLDDVRPDAPGEHVEVVATINGTQIRLVVERLARDRRFAEARLRISGRGRAAWLSDPHSPIVTRHNESALTAQQILEAALTENEVSIGWSIDWRLEDWLVAAGAYSHTGSYIDHANRIAEAGGAIIQPHDTAQTLIVQPRYPAAPWNWHTLTPDIELPEDVVEVEGIEWLDRPPYNAVWVGDGNRLDKIKRTGTAGDIHAQTIIDALATAPEATRQRGIATLGDTGRQAHISLRLPVLEESGIIRPGQLMRYVEQGQTHTGLARAVSVDVGFPETWQTVRLETHDLELV